ncbi:unnamed protein product [Ilex paraguariensis]|uniref:Uncharacterized protein n=1 Tax=Ilex paraguariensis TaxID=185542 RepID=A0ABC8R4Z4_9AQUA
MSGNKATPYLSSTPPNSSTKVISTLPSSTLKQTPWGRASLHNIDICYQYLPSTNIIGIPLAPQNSSNCTLQKSSRLSNLLAA